MLALCWGISKFAYELKGRKFIVETDHKTLLSIRDKLEYNNDRINRWIEKINNYDFKVNYISGKNMGIADFLSRQHEGEIIKEKKEKIKEHKDFWLNDKNEVKTIPPMEERKSLIKKVHEDMCHRSHLTIYKEMIKNYYWPKMIDLIKKVCNECIKCQEINRKNRNPVVFISTRKKFEKFGIDIKEFEKGDKLMLVRIDYHTRYGFAEIIKDKKAKTITSKLESWFNGIYPEEIIIDNAREFKSFELNEFCTKNNINIHYTSLEAHRSNGRVERLISTLVNMILKSNEAFWNGKVKQAINAYNNCFHRVIQCTPNEAYENPCKIKCNGINEYADEIHC